MSSAICFNSDQSEILLSGNELTHYHRVTTFDNSGKETSREIVGTAFSLFPTMFSTVPFPK